MLDIKLSHLLNYLFKDGLSENSKVNVTNIICDNNQITIDVFLQITVPLPSELSIQNLDINDNNGN
jgi:hypothetical protein